MLSIDFSAAFLSSQMLMLAFFKLNKIFKVLGSIYSDMKWKLDQVLMNLRQNIQLLPERTEC